MVLNYYSQHDDDTAATDHLKDSTFKMVIVGYAIPTCILAVIGTNFLVGKVFVPAGRGLSGDVFDGLIQSYPLGWQFAGIVSMKFGLAAALFSWYALANHAKTERWAQVALMASIVVFGFGFVLYAVGFFV